MIFRATASWPGVSWRSVRILGIGLALLGALGPLASPARPESRLELAHRLAFGLGGDRADWPRARRAYSDAAKENEVAAAQVAVYRATGYLGMDRDRGARELLGELAAALEKNAAAGDVAANEVLGQITALGLLDAPSRAAARPYFLTALEAGSTTSATWLGWIHAHGGQDLEPDAEVARSFYERALEAGDLRGLVDYGNLLARGGSVLGRDSKRGVELLDRAARAGYPPAMGLLAEILFDGIGVRPDRARAIELAEKGAALGSPRAFAVLGFAYKKGLGVDQDGAAAAAHYRDAARLGLPLSAYRLGWMLILGEGIPKDVAEGLRLLETAATDGLPVAARSLGELYDFDLWGVPRNEELALQWYRRAAELGDPHGLAFVRYQSAIAERERTSPP